MHYQSLIYQMKMKHLILYVMSLKIKMSYDLDEDGNKFFYDPDLENEDNLELYRIEFTGVKYINAYSREDAESIFNDSDDIIDYVDSLD